MTPTFAVLFLALVCSTGIASKSADHDDNKQVDEIYEETTHNMLKYRTNINNILDENINEMKINKVDKDISISNGNMIREFEAERRVKREDNEQPECEPFTWKAGKMTLSHPKRGDGAMYANNTECTTVIEGSTETVVQLTFVDTFHIEEHPNCEYDYLEIRNGKHGYADSLGRYCGKTFPSILTSSGQYVWLIFKSDANIEYEGFNIQIEFIPKSNSRNVPSECYINSTGVTSGVINVTSPEVKKCKVATTSAYALDVLWYIETAPGTYIYLDFPNYKLEKPNECTDNIIQIFGKEPDFRYSLVAGGYCGSMANSLSTKGTDNKNKEDGNKMYVRLFASKMVRDHIEFAARYTAFRSLEENQACTEEEFDCEDSTCIDVKLVCDQVPNCRLKTDEDTSGICMGEAQSVMQQTHIQVILIIFSLILSGMSFVFLFKCVRKLYQDHKLIKEHIKQSCEDRLDALVDTQLTLDPKLLGLDDEPRASLERDNHTNEMYKQQRRKRKPSSIDSDYIQETHLDLDDEPWIRTAESKPLEPEDVRIEHKGRSRSDTSRKEESLRSRSARESEDRESRKEIRDVSVGAPDTKESGCQTRESLFQTAPSSDGTESGSNSRGFSTFGYSGATIARPSPPATANTTQLTIELLRQVPHQDSLKSHKKISDRRPMSTETTRSAPDVIIVSKPIR